MPVETSEIMSVPEASRLLGVSPNVAYDYCRRGLIPCIRLGGRVLIPRGRFRAWLDGKSDQQAEMTTGPSDGQ